jgi:ribose transport system ATP-binding protein
LGRLLTWNGTPAQQGSHQEDLLKIMQVSKRFGSTQALNRFDLSLAAGEVLALLGENGAGKSTLIKILAGVFEPDGGQLLIDGHSVDWGASEYFSFVHQELGLIGDMSVAENIALGAGFSKGRIGLVNWRKVREAAREALNRVNLDVPVESPVKSLSPAHQSLVAIARALAHDAKILVLDEPSATLGPHETSTLFAAIQHLKGQGVGVIYVTHRLDEMAAIADRVAVLRNGELVLAGATAAVSRAQLNAAIAGRELSQASFAPNRRDHKTLACLEFKDVITHEAGPFSLEIFPGEITALTGLVGAGQHSISRVLRGEAPLCGGEVRLRGRLVKRPRASKMVAEGITFTPTDRIQEGIAPTLTVRENLIPRPRNGKHPLAAFSRRSERMRVTELAKMYRVKPEASEISILSLSGGNQQKVVVARALQSEPDIVVFEDPTIGVDVGAKDEIYRILSSAAGRGVAVILVTSDLEEVGRISGRALVFRNGLLVADVVGSELTEARIMDLALGGAESGRPPSGPEDLRMVVGA